jgi:hypothetical protein
MVRWPVALWPVVRQYIMVGPCKSRLLTSQLPVSKKRDRACHWWFMPVTYLLGS